MLRPDGIGRSQVIPVFHSKHYRHLVKFPDLGHAGAQGTIDKRMIFIGTIYSNSILLALPAFLGRFLRLGLLPRSDRNADKEIDTLIS